MWIYGLYVVNVILLIIVAIIEARRPAHALLWLIVGLFLPVIGFVLYIFFTNPAPLHRTKLISPNRESGTLPDSFSHSSLVISKAVSPLTVNGLRTGHVQLLTNGIETYDQLLSSIQKAKKTIDIEYFQFRADRIGSRFIELLIERAEAGVQVRFVKDGKGSRKFPRRSLERMEIAGIECRTIFPLRFPWLVSNLIYRDHCKIVVIDEKEAYTGGLNIGYEYTGMKPGVGFWRDTHVRIIGEAAADLLSVFNSHWNVASADRNRNRRLSNNHGRSGRSALTSLSTEMGSELGIRPSGLDVMHNAHIQTLEGNYRLSTPVVKEAFFICLTQAERTIDVTTPYFVPDADIVTALRSSVARGVRVRLLVPSQSDRKVVDLASRTYFGPLLEAGVQIYMYKKGMLHAKLMVIDGEISEIGSPNYDNSGFHLNYEVSGIVYSAEVAKELTDQFESDLAQSVPISMEDFQQRSRSQRLIEQGARLLSPLL